MVAFGMKSGTGEPDPDFIHYRIFLCSVWDIRILLPAQKKRELRVVGYFEL